MNFKKKEDIIELEEKVNNFLISIVFSFNVEIVEFIS